MVYRYVPLLRAKAGEANALFNLTPQAKDRMFPILHLATSITPALIVKIGNAWSGRSLGLDGLFNFDATGSAADMQTVFNGLRAAGVSVVPCVEYGASAGYLAAVGPMAQTANSGLVVKSRLGDLGAVEAWLVGGGWATQNIDLVITAGHIADIGPGVLDAVVAHALQNLANPQAWRSVTLAGSAAPKDMSALSLGANLVPRLDWQLWQATAPQQAYQVDYGDFGISHPDMTEPPGYVMGKATVSVRYSLDDQWLVVKGRPVSGNNGIPMPAQYSSHAQTLSGAPGFGGLVGCWGDGRIGRITSSAGTPGSRQTWVEIGVSRHLSLVADRLP